jgi:hypothetical protein
MVEDQKRGGLRGSCDQVGHKGHKAAEVRLPVDFKAATVVAQYRVQT